MRKGFLGSNPGNGKDYHSLIHYARPRGQRPQVSPFPQIAQVVALNPDDGSVQVLLRSGMILRAVVPTYGPNDALRVHAPPLPALFTTGHVTFPHGDIRNAVWQGGFPAAGTDAYNAAQNSPFDNYHAHYGGGWDLLAQNGDQAKVWSDSSALIVGFSGLLPTTYRHTVVQTASGAQRQRTVYSQAQRRPTAASPFSFILNHVTGAQVAVGASGGIAAVAASGQAINLIANGATVTIDGMGNISLLTAAGGTLTAQATTALVSANEVQLGGLSGGRAVARVGDPVSGGVITGGSSKVFSS